MKKITLLLLILQVLSNAYCQLDFRKGVIFKLNMDSSNCDLLYNNDVPSSARCQYKKDNGSIGTYSPTDIFGYKYIGGKFYISKVYKSNNKAKRTFVEYLVHGRKNLYFHRDTIGDHFLIDLSEDTVIELPYEEKTILVDGRAYLQESMVHKRLLYSYLKDCPGVYNAIENINKPEFGNLLPLIKDYHHLVCNDSGCIVYYKAKYKFRIEIDPQVGIIYYYTGNSPVAQYGVSLLFWIPKLNENMFLKTGLGIYNYSSSYKEDQYNGNIFKKIPIQLEYRIPRKIIRFKWDFGVNWLIANQDILGWTVTASPGILIRLGKFVSLDLNAESELLILRYFTISLNSGLAYNFN